MIVRRARSHSAIALATLLANVLALGHSARATAQSTHDSALRAARESSEPAVVAEHLRRALEEVPGDAAAFEVALEKLGADPDLAASWRLERAFSLVDAAGKLPRPKDQESLGRPPLDLESLATLRAKALGELGDRAKALRFHARRSPGAPVEALSLRELARSMLHGSPVLEKALLPLFDDAVARSLAPIGDVIEALERARDKAKRAGRDEEVIRICRLLLGICRQAGQKDLQGGKAPDLAGLERSSRDALGAARDALRAKDGRPWTLDELYELDEEEVRRFDEQYSSPDHPARALSVEGRYVVETTCGFETLIGVAETVEYHHARLANWFGEDPFVGRTGRVLVVPEQGDLEREGSPYWWAGGFQSGDQTTVRFACSTVEGLGRTLTHELTHRFDGAVHPGTPAWLAEGRAVWTAAAYARTPDTDFPPLHALRGTMEHALLLGYGGEAKLEKLVAGTIEDYRDNYSAGYALYVYLDTFEEPEGHRLFSSRWSSFYGSSQRDPVERFTAAFVDGKEGRPATLAEFARGFGEFLQGFYWQTPAPWIGRYAVDRDERGDDPYVYDGPTWVYTRHRAEPFFGQDHASAAAQLFLDLGDEESARTAFAAALGVDEPDRELCLAIADSYQRGRQNDAAWILRHDPAFRAEAAPAPFVRELPATRAYLEALLQTRDALVALARPATAALLEAEHDLVAERLGLPLLCKGPIDPAAVPLETAPRTLRADGYEEVSLTGYDERRVPGLWYETEQGDLHVGRQKPRDVTGDLERTAHQRDAFVRGTRPIEAGRWTFRATIECTTSFVSGDVVFGMSRRDRNLRVHFSAGDFLYAIGQKETSGTIDRLNVDVSGLRERDGGLRGSTTGRTVRFERPRPTFEIALVVDGPAVHVLVEGESIGVYHTVDGRPIEGQVGFAMGQGAIRVHDARVERADRGRALHQPCSASLDPLCPSDLSDASFQNRHLLGLPAFPLGAFVLWVPVPAPAEGERVDAPLRALEFLEKDLREREWPQALVVLLPRTGLPEADREALRAHCASSPAAPLLVEHQWWEYDTNEEERRGDGAPWVLFVDPAGAVRFAWPWFQLRVGFHENARHWVRVHSSRQAAGEGPPLRPGEPHSGSDDSDGDDGNVLPR